MRTAAYNRPNAPRGIEHSGDHPSHREREESDQHHAPVADPLDEAVAKHATVTVRSLAITGVWAVQALGLA